MTRISVQKNPKALSQSFNETSWDHWRGNTEATLLASATRSAGTNSPDQVNYNARGVVVTMKITARTVGASPQINLRIDFKYPVTGDLWTHVVTQNFDPTTGQHMFVLYPGVQATHIGTYNNNVQGVAGSVLPRQWRVAVIHTADITDITYSLAASYIL